MFIRFGFALSLICAGPVSAAADDANMEDARNLVRSMCTHCHGLTGNSRSTRFQPVPMLAGQPAIYLLQEMRNYASGAREDKSKRSTMSNVLKLLTDKQLENIAAYYEAQKRY